MTSIKLTHPLQHNRIKVAQKFSAFLLLVCCFIPNFVAPVNSEETMAMLEIRIKLAHPLKKIKRN